MEITASCLNKYNVAKVTIGPPYLEGDIMDIKLTFLSKKAPGLIKGFLTVDKNGKYIPRSYGAPHSPTSQLARTRLRTGIKQLATQLIGELDDA